MLRENLSNVISWSFLDLLVVIFTIFVVICLIYDETKKNERLFKRTNHRGIGRAAYDSGIYGMEYSSF